MLFSNCTILKTTAQEKGKQIVFGPCVYPKQRDAKFYNSTFVTFIDLQKAFDTVDRELLYHCLLNNGIDGKLYYSIKSLYANVQSRVRLNNINTICFQCNVGVRQEHNFLAIN